MYTCTYVFIQSTSYTCRILIELDFLNRFFKNTQMKICSLGAQLFHVDRWTEIFMLCWPCILIYPCNENQLYALFIPSLLCQSTSTCFGHISSPSSGGTLYIYNNWYVLCLLVECLLAGLGWNCLLYVYGKPPDDGLKICPKYVQVDGRNKLRKNSASSWFSLHGWTDSETWQS
jgi:hypothetical protein